MKNDLYLPFSGTRGYTSPYNTFQINDTGYYWSSTSSRSYAKDAWRVNFKNGSSSHYYKTNNYYVRCVREEK